METIKTELSLYAAILSFLLGLGAMLNFRRDFYLFETSVWSYIWPLLLAALFFYLAVILFSVFWNRRKEKAEKKR